MTLPDRQELHRQWLDITVGRNPHGMYAPLDRAGLADIWRFIERRYLDYYTLFLRVCSLPVSQGLWPIDYPDCHLRTDRAIAFDAHGIPPWLEDALGRWSDNKEDAEFGYAHEGWPQPDFAAIDAQGLALAGQLKQHVGVRVYVEYRPWREIMLDNGAPFEADMPEPIARHAKASAGRTDHTAK